MSGNILHIIYKKYNKCSKLGILIVYSVENVCCTVHNFDIVWNFHIMGSAKLIRKAVGYGDWWLLVTHRSLAGCAPCAV